jgi:biopolymer transport protein ExbD
MLDVSADYTTTTPSSMNIMPLLDVMLLLLIFFLLASSFMRPTLQIDLPQAASSQVPPEPQRPIMVSLDRHGQITLDTVPMSMAQLKSSLVTALTSDRQRPVRLQADKHSAFGRFVAIMDAAKEAGAAQLLIETTTTTEDRHHGQ